jgi:septal ring factor EnvC (AmiA/AmiB activator)
MKQQGVSQHMNSLLSVLTPAISRLLLLVALIFVEVAQPPVAEASASSEPVSQEASEATLDKLKAGIKRITQWLSRADNEKSGLNKELKQVELNVNHLSKLIRNIKQKIQLNEEKLSTLRTELTAHQHNLAVQRKYLEKQIQITYFQEENSKLKLLLNTDNPQDLGRQMHYFDVIKEARTKKIIKLNTLLQKVQETEQAINTKTEDLKQQSEDLHKRQIELSDTLKKKQAILAKLEKTIQSNNERLEKMRADQARVEDLLQELEASVINLPLPRDSEPFSKQKSKLPWPSRAKVSAKFGSKIANGKLTQNGIRFDTKEDDAVTAIYSGRVIFSNWIRGFGLLIIVDHGEQFMSLYGNNKSLTKETGDWVRAGETIAVSSESTTNPESGLYFEIRKNGQPLNPQQWLRK